MNKGIVHRRFSIEPYLWLLPAFAVFAVFTFHPFIQTIIKSLFIVDSRGRTRLFVGLDNYKYILADGKFLKSIKVSLIYAAVTVPLSKVIGLLLAILSKKKRRLSPVYETCFSLSMVMASSVMAMIFQLMYLPTLGVINGVFGIDVDWLNDERYALMAVMLVQVWLLVGHDFLFLLVSVRSIPGEIMESADIDGIPFFRRLFKLYIPLVSPTMFYLICTDIPFCMLQMSLTNILTEGGPNYSTMTVMQYIYKQFAGAGNYTNSNPASVITFAIILVITELSFVFEKRRVFYQ